MVAASAQETFLCHPLVRNGGDLCFFAKCETDNGINLAHCVNANKSLISRVLNRILQVGTTTGDNELCVRICVRERSKKEQLMISNFRVEPIFRVDYL